MAYKRITVMDIWEIIRRWHNRQSVSHIASALGYDRKTVRKYIEYAKAQGLSSDEPLPAKEHIYKLFEKAIHKQERCRPAQKILQPFFAEISQLIHHREHPLKPKIAFEVIVERHALHGKVSYSSFKRFVRHNNIVIFANKATCRMETPPGQEVQIDYAKMGLLYDPLSGRKRTVYAFIATLSHSRHKFVQFVFKQDQRSFVASHIDMFEYFEGVPHIIRIDNLKNGVIKPDLYDPKLNRTYREMAEYYGCFIDPCRVRHPKDKGKVERDVQTIRQQFRKLLALYPDLNIAQANRLIRIWAQQQYGQKEHGTTHLKPYQVFVQREKPALRPLPLEPYEIALWKQATVHPDHYIQINKKAYSVPTAYVGKKLWVRATDKVVKIYDEHKLIKQHAVTQYYRHTDLNDFPANIKAALDEGMPLKLQQQAANVGKHFARLIRSVLEPHAFINMRKAQALLALAEKHQASELNKAAQLALQQHISLTPKGFKRFIEKLKEQPENNQLPLSKQSAEFVRPADYFTH